MHLYLNFFDPLAVPHMRLTGKQIAQIRDALLAAFSKATLREMVRIELDEVLEHIADGENFRIVAFNLVSWAEQHGRMDDLIGGAHNYNPENEEIRKLVQAAKMWNNNKDSVGGNVTTFRPVSTAQSGLISIDVFLSYSRNDGTSMRMVYNALRAHGLSVWIDEGLEPGTSSWVEAIEESITQASVFVVLLSPNAKASTWVKNEIHYALTHKKPCVPVLLSGDEASAIPISLISRQWADGRRDLASTVRQLLPQLLRLVRSPDAYPATSYPLFAEQTVSFRADSQEGLGSHSFATLGGVIRVTNRDGNTEISRTHAATFSLGGHRYSANVIALYPDSRTNTLTPRNQRIPVRDALPGTFLRRLTGHTGVVRSVAFSPDGNTIISAGNDSAVRFWDPLTGVPHTSATSNGNWIYSVCFSPDGKLVACALADSTVLLLDAKTKTHQWLLRGHSAAVRSVVFGPSGKFAASGGDDGSVQLWNVQEARHVHTCRAHTDSVRSVAMSPDGNLLVSASLDTTLRLWDMQSGKLLQTISGHTDSVHAVSFSPDGKLIASAGNDNTVRLWNAQTGASHKTLLGHTGWVHSVAFSPDGKFVASAGLDKIVLLWDIRTSVPACAFSGHTDSVTSVAFSPDGKVVASAGLDNSVRIWRANAEQRE